MINKQSVKKQMNMNIDDFLHNNYWIVTDYMKISDIKNVLSVNKKLNKIFKYLYEHPKFSFNYDMMLFDDDEIIVDGIIYNTDKICSFHNVTDLTFLIYYKNLRHIKFSKDFDEPIIKLKKYCPKLISVKFGNLFNQDVESDSESYLPFGLKSLYFGKNFRQSIHFLPDTLETLYFNEYSLFCGEIKSLPKNLINLSMGENFWCCINNLPENLRILDLSCCEHFNQELIFPPNLEILYLGKRYNQPINNLPKNLKKIKFFDAYKCDLDTLFNHKIDNLPENLKSIYLSEEFNQPIDNLPKKLEKLIFSVNSYFNYPVEKLPPNLKKIKFGWKFNQPINNLPKTLEVLEFDDDTEFQQSLDNLPDSIIKLSISGNYSQKINKLPKNLKVIEIGLFMGGGYKIFIDKFTDVDGKIDYERINKKIEKCFCVH